MTPDPQRWSRVEELYHAALEHEPSARAAFLEDACSGDAELMREVQSLLSQNDRAEALLDRPVWDVTQAMATSSQSRGPRFSTGDLLGPYKILAPIGAGGMGEVYRARDTRLGREVAVKVLPAIYSRDSDRLQRFEHEARTASALNHPNIMSIYDVGTHQQSPYLVCELLDGETLREKLAGKALPVRRAVDYALQIARGLAAAHQKAIVHRDLKPENIFVTRDGRVKILDFGLAKLTAPPEVSEDASTIAMATPKTEPGIVMGTIAYMAPEQVRGLRVDGRADLFAFGAIFYEMLTGGRAFQGASSADIMSAILREDPPPIEDAAIDRLVRRCLEKTPEQRFQSAHDLEFALAALGEHSRLQVATASRKRAAPIPIAAAIMCAAIAIAFLAGRFSGKAQPPASPVFRQLTFGRGTIGSAIFAPDGQTVVYSALWEGKPMETFETRLGSPGSRSLFPGYGLFGISSASDLALSQCSHLNWGSCQGTLARVPLAGGAPRPVLENVDWAAWGPDGNSMAIVHAVDGRYQIEFPIGTVWYKSAGFITGLAVSSGGDRIAFCDHPVLGNITGSLVVVDRAGHKKELVKDWDLNAGLVWTRGGSEIWFDGSKAGRNHGIFAISLSGDLRKVLDVPGGLTLFDISRDGRALLAGGTPRSGIISQRPGDDKPRDLSWFDWSTVADLSADGKTLLFWEWGDAIGGAARTYLRKTDGSPALELGEGKPLVLSPDGKWALAVHQSTPPKLILLPTGAGQPKTLVPADVSEYYIAFWFPDSNRISFVGSVPGHAPRSYSQDLDGGTPTPLTDEGTIALLISPDGNRMLINSAGDYYLVPAHGDRIPVKGMEEDDVPIQWSSDGRSLFLRARGEFTAPIYTLDLATGQRKPWKVLAPADPAGVFNIGSDNSLRLTPDGKSYAFTYWSLFDNLFIADGLK